MESARAMIAHAGLSKEYWAEAVATAAYLRNRTATSALKEEKTPYEKWYERKPDISHLKVFGCAAYLDSEGRGLDGKAEKLPFVGYCKNSKGYRLLDEKTRKILKKRDVTFNESKFDLSKTKSETVKHVIVDLESETSEKEQEKLRDEQPREEPQEEPCHSERERRPPNRYGFSEYADTAKVDHLAYNICQIVELNTIIVSEHTKKWKEAADSEYKLLMENETQELKLVNLPEDREAVGCKWVFNIKHTSGGKNRTFQKGRLVMVTQSAN